eukprot:gene3481-3751_t
MADKHDGPAASIISAARKPFQTLTQPLIKVLREQLGPGELDAAARVCKAWAAQLADDVVHSEMALPGSYERLLCQLEQLNKRFKNVHSWRLWLPAGSDWACVDELRLLWLLGRYKVEKLQLDGGLHWHHRDQPTLPVLDADVMPWMTSLRSLQVLNLSLCTLAAPAGLAYLSFLPKLHTVIFGIQAAAADSWEQQGLLPLLPHLSKLQQVSHVEVHVEDVQQLPAQLPEQVQQLFRSCGRLRKFMVKLGQVWGLLQDAEYAVFERVELELHFPAGAVSHGLAVVGGGRFIQLLLRQMLLLRRLKLMGVRSCEAGDHVAHLWRSIGQLRGLTSLSYMDRTPSTTPRVTMAPPSPPEGSAAAAAAAARHDVIGEPPPAPLTHKLQLDALLMQLAAGLANLQKLKLVVPHATAPVPNSTSSGGSSLDRFGPRHLQVLVAAPRLRELVVELPVQCGGFTAAAAGILSLTVMSGLRLLDIKCAVVGRGGVDAGITQHLPRVMGRGLAAAAADAAAAANGNGNGIGT